MRLSLNCPIKCNFWGSLQFGVQSNDLSYDRGVQVTSGSLRSLETAAAARRG